MCGPHCAMRHSDVPHDSLVAHSNTFNFTTFQTYCIGPAVRKASELLECLPGILYSTLALF